MKAQVLYGINDLRYEENYPHPVLKDGEVLVKVHACGICGSDVGRVLKSGAWFSPAILGHEFSGVVVEVSNNQDKQYLGKFVAVFPLIPCRKCLSCSLGNYHLCESYNYLGSRCNGGFAEYVAVPVWNLKVLPDNLSLEIGALFEPVAVSFHALNLLGEYSGKTILVTGTGTMASIIVKLALLGGASRVIVLGRNGKKLDFIKHQNPEAYIVNSALSTWMESIINISSGLVDCVIEATGNASMLEKCIEAVRRKGTVVLMGNPEENIELRKEIFWQILRKEVTLRGSWNSSYEINKENDWNHVLTILNNANLNFESIITHKISLSQLRDGIEIMTNKDVLSNKVMVVNNG